MNVLKVENLWKEYRLGVIGHGTLTRDLQSWWARVKGKEDPNSKILALGRQKKQIEGDRFWALRDINLDVNQGEIIGIIGKNGAGKSTLLKILSRVTAPTQGMIRVKGRIASLLEVGTGFHPELTGRENIFLNGAILGMSKVEISKKSDEIISFSEVEKYIDTPVKRYSSGMHVRLAFAVAAHLDPEILIIDEVLAVGDAGFQKKCLGKLGEVSSEGRTILFVSHNMGAVKALTNKCIYLDAGCILSSGKTSEIIDRYLSKDEINDIVDIKNAKRARRDLGSDIRITNIEPWGNDNYKFLFGQNLRFRINIQSKIDKNNLRFGLTVQNLLGENMVGSFTSEEINLSSNSETKCLVTYRNLHLAPGMYRLGVSIGEGTLETQHINYDAISLGPIFEIVPIGVKGKELMKWEKSWGGLYHDSIDIDIC